MNVTRVEMKQNAKRSLSGRWGTAIGAELMVSLMPILALTVITLIIAFIFGEDSSVLSIVDTCFSIFVICPLILGLGAFSIRFLRREDVSATSPYDCFKNGNYSRFFFTGITMNIFIFLWTLLLIIPGIVKAYSYDMAAYLLEDNPDWSWKEAIGTSKKIMNGHKMELFILDLSFIPWHFLACLTCGILYLYVAPYITMTRGNFYRALINESLENTGSESGTENTDYNYQAEV